MSDAIGFPTKVAIWPLESRPRAMRPPAPAWIAADPYGERMSARVPTALLEDIRDDVDRLAQWPAAALPVGAKVVDQIAFASAALEDLKGALQPGGDGRRHGLGHGLDGGSARQRVVETEPPRRTLQRRRQADSVTRRGPNRRDGCDPQKGLAAPARDAQRTRDPPDDPVASHRPERRPRRDRGLCPGSRRPR